MYCIKQSKHFDISDKNIYFIFDNIEDDGNLAEEKQGIFLFMEKAAGTAAHRVVSHSSYS